MPPRNGITCMASIGASKHSQIKWEKVGPPAVPIGDAHESLEGDRFAAQQISASTASLRIHRHLDILLS
jgi:hypothetical protein